ncbi:hypothetical protein CkaCkLH20_00942 [Colletotrichum karsti]|uniref:C6 zinc finger domain protein n=1 Tax=Colletotrichum karsti TaxID=1095194 RepID=A0A9P6IIG1_9PEZI|nr:uncharacterized protein CkaCkLH20_00942 [Colletotrichum karsti]KAF9881796.1 hypothetical protein CkaCkLH20_00942 [Colletotrichum karsti]
MLYFQEFVQLSRAPWTNATSKGDLWEVTLPQLARTSGTLRSAATAIGALSMWHRQSKIRSLGGTSMPGTSENEGDVHYFNAIAHYCRSLRQQSQQASLQDAIVLSVLLLFFETLRDNRKAALDHINHGLCLLLAIVTDDNAQHHIVRLAPNPKPLLAAVADVFNHLAKQARIVLRDRMGQGPPLPNLTKVLRNHNHNLESFMVLLSQMPSSMDIGDIPATFNSLDDFEESWAAVKRVQSAMRPIMIEFVYDSGVMNSQDEEVILGLHAELLGNARIREIAEKSSKAMEAIDVAFQPLFNNIVMSYNLESPIYLRAIHLRLQYLGMYIFENPPQFLDAASLKALSHMFREYLSVASIALHAAKREANQNPAHQLSLQCDIAWYLLILALFCRDPLLRDEAVMMLRDYPGQDGLWTTRSLHALAERNRTVERINAVEGTPDDQWRRLWRREFVFEDGGDRILFRYLERDEVTCKWNVVEDVAEVRGQLEEVQWKRQPLSGRGGMLVAEIYAYDKMNDA